MSRCEVHRFKSEVNTTTTTMSTTEALLIDLTEDNDETNTASPVSPPQRLTVIKVENIHFTPPPGSDVPPVLEPAVPIQQSSLQPSTSTNSNTPYERTPPVLEAEVSIIANEQGAIASPPNARKEPSALPDHRTHNGNKESHQTKNQYSRPGVGFKNLTRISKVTASNGMKRILVACKKTQDHVKKALIATEMGRNGISINRISPGRAENSGQRSRKRAFQSTCTQENIRILEKWFSVNKNPRPSEIHEISLDAKLETKTVKAWFRRKRKNNSENHEIPSCADRISLSDEVGRGRSQGQAGTSQESVERNCNSNDNFRPKNVPKYIRDPKDRTQDLDTIREDLANVGLCDSEKLNWLLKHKWEYKANRIFELTTNDFGMKKNILIESKRINDMMTSDCNPFSEAQEKIIVGWKKEYMKKLCENENRKDKRARRTTSELESVLHDLIMPWLSPLIYSKTTQQDGSHLTLYVALHDMCKISNYGRADEWDWTTPGLLQ